jgi:hypothetical protein
MAMFVFSEIRTFDDKVFWGECGVSGCDWKCQHTSHRKPEQANACLDRHLKTHGLLDPTE